ncbi:hypothetical protein [Gordonia sp. (in: high G+C Gram-positive bacteria)]|uniref:hypothetical protein n=1 Tax=Gordonia sp. (in: high G+C Gram-positive bacteria) TaxID=84139 RepID=UPI0016BBA702|nr:hypothetical protein [Gordonia sp. (in: high G+C Gram-positive bacteria)]NLG48126.1 hypothetical protein [Gordonia sp. (in: high G+C Gram-positive bacteria)]
MTVSVPCPAPPSRERWSGLYAGTVIAVAFVMGSFLFEALVQAVRFNINSVYVAWMWFGLIPAMVAAVAVAIVADPALRKAQTVAIAAFAAFGMWMVAQSVVSLQLLGAVPDSLWGVAWGLPSVLGKLGLVLIAAAWILGHRRHPWSLAAAPAAGALAYLFGAYAGDVVEVAGFPAPLDVAWRALFVDTIPGVASVVLACWLSVVLDHLLARRAAVVDDAG